MSGSALDGYTVSVSALPARPTPVTPTLAETARGHGPFGSLAMRGVEGRVVGVTDAQSMLGVRVPDRSRAILVVTVDGELAVAVRDAVSRGMAVVRDARSDDAGAIAASCLPWPWMIVGGSVSLPPALAPVLRNRPVLTYWLGSPPLGLPGHARVFDRPAALLDAVRRACDATVGGMRLAPGNGVELENGTLLRGAALESLVSAYPAGFALPARTFRSATDALTQHNIGWETRRDGDQSTRLARSTVVAAR
jgi:hypothetical protein